VGETWRTWIELGDFERALQATSDLTPGYRGSAQIEIAEKLTQAGFKSKARSVLQAAFPDLQNEPDNLIGQARYRFVLAAVHVGDLDMARKAAAQIATMADKPHVLPAVPLENAAIAYNEIGDRVQADAFLRRAVPLIPGDGPILGVSAVGSSMRSGIAEQFALAGDKVMFDSQYNQLSPYWKARFWTEVCGPDQFQPQFEPECEKRAGPDTLLQRVVGMAENNDDDASRALAVAIDGYRNVDPD
jgi:tetratricopeptide (TPR) repeat protein